MILLRLVMMVLSLHHDYSATVYCLRYIQHRRHFRSLLYSPFVLSDCCYTNNQVLLLIFSRSVATARMRPTTNWVLNFHARPLGQPPWLEHKFSNQTVVGLMVIITIAAKMCVYIQWNLSERTPLLCGHFSITDDFLGPKRNYYKTFWKLISLMRTPSIMDTDMQNTAQNVIITSLTWTLYFEKS
jgi:hypothetical protein